jgi:hypothetical protein
VDHVPTNCVFIAEAKEIRHVPASNKDFKVIEAIIYAPNERVGFSSSRREGARLRDLKIANCRDYGY